MTATRAFARRSLILLVAGGVVVAGSLPRAVQQAQPQPQTQKPRSTFKSNTTLVSVDVIVRDAKGNIIRDLKPEDFDVREDGQPQPVTTFSFQEIKEHPASTAPVELLGGVAERVKEEARTGVAATTKPVDEEAPKPMSSEALAGRRLIVLLFDVSSMQPEDVQRAVESARKYAAQQMAESDLVSVATVGSVLDILTDFTSDKTKVEEALTKLAYTEGTETPPATASTAATDEATAAGEDTTSTDAAELDMFNNDMRLRALRSLAEALGPIEQKKAILYFSAGMQRSGQDNQVELRSAVNAAVRGNVSIYPIDTRGLQAVVPGGDATQASGRGQSLFNGRGISQQFSRLAASQDTLTSLAADTGGRAFTDSNNFGEAFARVQRDMSAYYLLGYSSSNPSKDGRFRRIRVTVKREGLRVEARAGYYADRDFAHTAKSDREMQLEEQMFSAVSSTDLPVFVTADWFRLAPDKYYVPVAMAVPGSAVPVASEKDIVTLDVLGMISDEQGRPVGRWRQTMQLPAGTGKTLAGKQVLYQTGVTLPPGRFAVKFVVRENTHGTIGSFEAPITVPELKTAAVKVSSVILSTQLQAAPKGKSDNPLVKDGVQLLPNLTHVVGRDQKLFVYYEVYESVTEGASTDIRTSLAFYRGKVKVFETPVVERTAVDVPSRKATVFQFEVPVSSFKPGAYTCQINIIDAAAGKFAFPRTAFYVR